VIDLSHRARWDLQDAEIGGIQPLGIQVPDIPGQCGFENGILINRMNRTQASIWHLSGETPALPDDPAFTDITDSTVFLAVCGKDLFSILEKLTSLDFLDPSQKTPFLLQGPFSHVPCQIVTLEKTPERSGILVTCSRGYARDMVGAILEAGAEFKLRPAGEQAFTGWLNELG
jgi:glycine cleavage system aminomethyltransferase T